MSAGFVYAIRCAGLVKLGWSNDPARRATNLQIGNPDACTLVGVIPGTLGDERSLHERFAAHRQRGEWFRLEGDLAHFVASMPVPIRASRSAGLEPAKSIIAKFGGPARVSDITGAARSAPYRWMQAVDEGGTGGHIPPQRMAKLVDHARANGIDLLIDDVFPAAAAAA